ncbi:hypothetical protein EDD22DRAFT_905382, partial [Suillus occidentalis]
MPLHLPFAVPLFVVYVTCSSTHDTTPMTMTIGRYPTPTRHPSPSPTSIISEHFCQMRPLQMQLQQEFQFGKSQGYHVLELEVSRSLQLQSMASRKGQTGDQPHI